MTATLDESGETATVRNGRLLSSEPEKLRGCILTLPTGDKSAPRLWAVGVVVGDGKAVYLFDPRLGLPLPGPGGPTPAPTVVDQTQPAAFH